MPREVAQGGGYPGAVVQGQSGRIAQRTLRIKMKPSQILRRAKEAERQK